MDSGFGLKVISTQTSLTQYVPISKAIYLSWNKGLWAKEYVNFFYKTIESKQNVCFLKILPLG